MNGFVGAMVGGFELAGRLVMGVRAVVKAAVGKRAAEPFVKEQEEQGDLNPFWGETVGVAGSVTLQQPVGFELAQVVAELVQPVGAVGEVEGGEDGVVDVLGGPATDLTTAVQEDLDPTKWPKIGEEHTLLDHPIVREVFQGSAGEAAEGGWGIAKEHEVEGGPGGTDQPAAL